MSDSLDNEARLLGLCEELYFALLKANKPDWDSFFMRLAKTVSTRSPDKHTKHGCVIVDCNNRILSTGYNGPIQGIDDSVVPLDRPAKYLYFIHAEQNAILFCTASMQRSTAYITGFPCNLCFKELAQKGCVRVVYGDVNSACLSDQEKESIRIMAQLKGMALDAFDGGPRA